MVDSIGTAASEGAELVLFPEAALTGLISSDDPAHDLPLGRSIPGPETEALAQAACRHSVYVGTGLLERDSDSLYDSAILLGPSGELSLAYRRIQPQWHGRGADPEIYRQGDECRVIPTPFGKMGFLICGDLFDDDVVKRMRELEPDCVLFPISRNFSDASFDQEKWDREEEPEYARRAGLLGCTVLMVDQLEDRELSDYPSFGGAMVVSASGDIVARWPLAKKGILLADV